MAFINEYISAEDIKKFDIEAINKSYTCGGISRQWTIDRTRNIYLREVAAGVGHSGKNRVWHFYWHGDFIELKIEILSSKGGRDEPNWAHKRVHGFQLPDHLRQNHAEILSDLKEALIAYKDGGVFASATSYTLDLEICEEGAE